MNYRHAIQIGFVSSALLTMPWAQAANLSNAEFYEMKNQITTQYKTAKAACASMKGNAKDVCVEEATASEKLARAELQYKYSNKPADQTNVALVKADGAYAVAKEKCDDKAGNDKDVCVKEAKAVQTKARVDAQANRQISDARKEGASEKRDADYSVATEKCDALVGTAKSNCIASAKVRFGKS